MEGLSKDVWSLILKHMGLKTMRSLRLTNKAIERKTREYFFARFVFSLDRMSSEIEYPSIRKIYLAYAHDIQFLKQSFTYITHLYMGLAFNYAIDFPSNLTHLYMGDDFNRPISISHLSLTHLIMGLKFNNPIDIPLTVTHLRLGRYFNQHVVVPSSVTHFIILCRECGFIDVPSSVTHLRLGDYFNQRIVIPSNVTHLYIGNRFNQPINIPPSVTHLALGEHFTQAVSILPNLRYFNGPKRWDRVFASMNGLTPKIFNPTFW